MRNLILAIGIPVFVILAGITGYHLYGTSLNSVERSNPIASVVSTSDSDDSTDASLTTPDMASDTVLSLVNWEQDENAETPSACFTFNKDLRDQDAVSVQDFIRISPNIPTSPSITDNRICMSGFDYDEDYDVTFLEGLGGVSDTELPADKTLAVSFGDKPAYVAFAGEGIILPRINAQGLGIETINVDTLSVEIARVSDRMMARRDPQSGEATLEGDWGYEYENAAKGVRETIWSGTLPVKAIKNQKVTTVLAVSDLVGDLPPGGYIVTAERAHEEDEDRVARAWRWIISTDLALTSYHGTDGMTVSVRSLETAKLQSGIRLTLIAENNDILSETTTDAKGRAVFVAPLLNGSGAKSAKMLMAYGPQGDYAVLDLSRAPLDVSDHDVAGRQQTGRADFYGFTERGVYRPGETAFFTLMVRDQEAKATLNEPVTLSVKRPNGLEIFKTRLQAPALNEAAGTLTWSYDIPASAQRGSWTLDVSMDGIGEIGRVEFAVEDFVPQKLRLDVKTDEAPIDKDEIRNVRIDAQFLYGAPGGGLEAEAEARLRIDPRPFDKYSEFQFGPVDDDFEERLIQMGTSTTDGGGKAEFGLDIRAEELDTPLPLRAEIVAGVSEPGGRYIRESVRVPVRVKSRYIGIRNDFEGDRVARGKPAGFEIVSVDRDGVPQTETVTWTLFEENWDYQWYRDGGRWRYRRDVIDSVLSSGRLELSAQNLASFSRQLDWGDYRLDIEGSDGSQTSQRFSVGWGGTDRSDKPDSLRMAGPTAPLKAGDDITLTVNAPYAGEGELVIADDSVRLVRTVNIPEGGSEITIPFNQGWSQSVYAMLTVYTPRDVVDRPVPRRAVGVSYIKLDRTQQVLKLDIKTPEKIRPRQSQTFTVEVANAPRTENVWVNFAAVDEGILQITKYKSPDAAAHYIGKKALSIVLRDDYARLLNPNLDAPTLANSGGDSLGGEGLTVVPTRTVAMFTGPVSVSNGKAKITLDIPDFNGELRLMATAWSQTAIGSASTPVTVRDKVPAIVGLPRFLAPGDRAVATVSLDNVEGASGAYQAALTPSDLISGGGTVSLDLETGERREDKISLIASQMGVGNVSLNVNGPNKYDVTSTYPIQVRSPYRPVTYTRLTRLAAGQSLSLAQNLAEQGVIDGLVPMSTDVTVAFSQLAGINPAPYVQSLSRYPYGCTEQTVSTAMPLLYANDLGGFEHQSEADTARSVRLAIDRVTNRQGYDGAFGLWREGDGQARPWLGVFVTDFLSRAKAAGYDVPDSVMTRSYKALREIARMPRYPQLSYDFGFGIRYGDDRAAQRLKAEAASYAHYVLARDGQGDLSGLRYFYDNQSDKMETAVSFAYLGAGLDMMGDSRRSKVAFETGLSKRDTNITNDYYQSPLRDRAGFIVAASQAGEQGFVDDMIEGFVSELGEPNSLNTHEKIYAVLAMRALMENGEDINVSASGAELSDDRKKPSANILGSQITDAVSFKNNDADPVWVSVTVSGDPKAAPPASENGFNVSKTVFRMDGNKYQSGAVKQGERFVIRVGFNSTSNKNRTVVLADLLPAGFEIETILKPEDGSRRDGTQGAYDWVGNISDFNITEARDDRFIASVESYRRDSYVAAYIVRAVTPGDYVFPGVVVEDMYRPADRGVTQTTRMVITADPAL